MELNPDCIRDILFEVEDTTTYDDKFLYKPRDHDSFSRFNKYSIDEILYHFRQCELHGLFFKACIDSFENIDIVDLSPAGHEFLSNIRSNTIWSKTKNILEWLGVKSMDIVSKVAIGVITELIKQGLMQFPASP